jgi:hypothetical protein
MFNEPEVAGGKEAKKQSFISRQKIYSLELSLCGEVIFKAFWRGTRNWRSNLSPIASIFSRLEKTYLMLIPQ